MQAPTLQHKIPVKYNGHIVTVKILAYRKLTEYEIQDCISSYFSSLKKKKITKNQTVIIETIYGATDHI